MMHIVRARTVPTALAEQVNADGNRPFVKVAGDRWLTFTDIDRRSTSIASDLEQIGVHPGDRVAILSITRSEMVEAFHAIAKLGAVAVPLNPYLRGEFLRYQLDDSGAGVVILDGDGARQVAPILAGTKVSHVISLDSGSDLAGVEVLAYTELGSTSAATATPPIAPDAPMAICYTSGTTGRPKGVVISHCAYVCSPLPFLESDGWFTDEDIFLTTTPFYSFGTNGMFLGLGLCGGVPVVLSAEFHASTFLQLVRKEGATVVACTGMVGMAILAQPPSPDDGDNPMRLGVWTPMSVPKLREFARRFACETTNGIYGQSEGSPVARMPYPLPIDKEHTNGSVVDTLEVAILDDDGRALEPGAVGEISIRERQPNAMFSGYWRGSDEVVEARDGEWHLTGDHGRLDEEGFLTFVDRKRDSMRHRGQNVSSFELESAILLHPAIREVAAYPVPAELAEDEIMVSVVLKENAVLLPDELAQYFQQNIPYFAAPRYVDIVDRLPTNTMGRVTKDVLRAAGIPESAWDLKTLGLQQERRSRRG